MSLSSQKYIFNQHISICNFPSVSDQCRTRWLNGDNPSEEGDVESILQLLKTFPGQVCRNPISIEAQTASGISAKHTGDTFLS